MVGDISKLTWAMVGYVPTLKAITFPSVEIGYAVGLDGIMLKTVSGGAEWRRLDGGTDLSLTGLCFVDALHGYAVGEQGRLFATEDGGEHWEEHAHPIPRGHWPLVLVFITPERGFLAGSVGGMWQTSDGGRHWAAVSLPLLPSLGEGRYTPHGVRIAITAISFPTDLVGYALHAGRNLLRTDDGGEHWSLSLLPSAVEWGTLCFPTVMSGYLLDTRNVYRTRDGGQTWQPCLRDSSESLQGISFADAQQGMVIGAHGSVALTSDGGESWREARSSAIPDVALQAGACPSLDQRCVVGEDGVICTSGDSGVTWQARSSSVFGGILQIHFPNPRVGYCLTSVMGQTQMFRSEDAGRTWRTMTALGSRAAVYGEIHASFLGDTDGSVAIRDIGEDGNRRYVLLVTGDGGQTWEERGLPWPGRIRNLVFLDRLRGVLLHDRTPYWTEDGGLTWERGRVEGAGTLALGMLASGSGNLFATQLSGGLLRSDDGGRTWSTLSGSSHRSYQALWCLDAHRIFALENTNALYASEDAGDAWHPLILPALSAFESVLCPWFPTPARGYLFRTKSVVETLDGGKNWHQLPDGPPTSFLKGAAPIDEDAALVNVGGMRLYRFQPR